MESTIVNKFFLDVFYQLCHDFVKNYPKSTLSCNRLQTFAALESFSDLVTPNFGKTVLDKEKPFFFSRKWAASQYNPSKLSAEYPAMLTYEQPGKFIDAFRYKTSACYVLQVAFLDKHTKSIKEKGNGCESRTVSEVFYKTELFARNFFSYISDVCYYPDKGFYNAQIAGQLFPLIEKDIVVTRQFQKMISEENKEILFERYESPSSDIFGINMKINLCSITCDKFIYDGLAQEYKIGFDRSCC